MVDSTTATPVPPVKTLDYLEDHVRQQAQVRIQGLLEEEVDDLLGRLKYQRRGADAPKVYRNGHGRERKLTFSGGTLTLRRPRVRGLSERFESLILPLFQRQTQTVKNLLLELYLHGLAQGDFDLALRGLLGQEAPLSAQTLARLKAKWQDEYDRWRQRDLSGRDPVYLWGDGVYVKAGLEKDKAAMLVVIVAWADGSKEIVAVETTLEGNAEPSLNEFMKAFEAKYGESISQPAVYAGKRDAGLTKSRSKNSPKPTIVDLKKVKEAAKRHGGERKMLASLDAIEAVADSIGGFAALRDCLEFLNEK